MAFKEEQDVDLIDTAVAEDPTALDTPDDIDLADRMVAGREQIITELRKLIIGQQEVIDQMLLSLFVGGNSLLVGVPGLAKTLLIHTVAQVLDLNFSRIQFTPDLMPSDITGTDIIQEDPKTGRRQMVFAPGPIFANIVLADEINRTPPKTQSALLEAMQEHRVTVQGETYTLEEPFYVFATQNPIELEGTYPLPEAQLDRFMLKLVVDYPSRPEEKQILERFVLSQPEEARQVAGIKEVLAARSAVEEVLLEDAIRDYVVHVVYATRDPESYRLAELRPYIAYGASPRASIYLAQAARAHAFLAGRGYVTPDDVKAVARDVLRHRIVVSYEAEAEEVSSEDVVRRVPETVPVP